MPIDINNYIASGNPALYAGPILFRQGRADTPLLSMIGNRRRFVDSEIFVIGQHYVAPQPGDSVFSENYLALNTPDFAPVGRKQDTNVTELHAKALAQTDYSTGNTGMLSGPNLAGQNGVPLDEKAFQRAQKVNELALDLEHSFINSKYVYRNGDNSIANRTRGLNEAIVTNVINANGSEMSWNFLNELLICMADHGASTVGLVLGCDDITATQLAIEAKAEHYEVVTGVDNINGIAVTDIRTVRGVVRVVNLRFLPAGTAFVLNIGALSIVEQPFQNGNWTWFELGRQGASVVEMLQGACGLDYGYEGAHGKIVNIATGYTPYQGTKVFITNQVVPTVDEVPALSGAVLTSAQVGVATEALELSYVGDPTEDPTLEYQWMIGNSVAGAFTEIEGATGATYTPVAEDEGKFLKVLVTASGAAEGSVKSNAKKVAAAE